MKLMNLAFLWALIGFTCSNPLPHVTSFSYSVWLVRLKKEQIDQTLKGSWRSVDSVSDSSVEDSKPVALAYGVARDVQRWRRLWVKCSSIFSHSRTEFFQSNSIASVLRSSQSPHKSLGANSDTSGAQITITGLPSEEAGTLGEDLAAVKEDAAATRTAILETKGSQNLEREREGYFQRSLAHVLELSTYLQQQDVQLD